jgi:hypothetical protein
LPFKTGGLKPIPVIFIWLTFHLLFKFAYFASFNLEDYMNKRLFLVFLFLCFNFFVHAEKKHYHLTNDPIDVVIVAHPKDKETLKYCIDGIRENCINLGRIIVVSSEKLSDKAEWFDEKNFPFSLDDVYLAIGREDRATADRYFYRHWRPPGWYLQQLLKLYAPFVIPNISPNVLVLDADTVFMNPVSFLNEQNGGLFCVSHLRAKKRYLRFAERLTPGYKRVHPEVYSVCHHMLFQRAILEDLFATVEKHHKEVFWKAFCHAVDLGAQKGASEYEVYYNFALNHTDQVEIRELKWKIASI